MDNCIFCKIIKKQIPCHCVYEDEHALAFLDINPISDGHVVVIPKHHAEFMHELPPASIQALILAVQKVAAACTTPYNILNNNGELAGQVVKHVHFHVIPKTDNSGLRGEWKVLQEKKDFKEVQAEIFQRLK
ncbi:HIT_family protein [Hexamita inflata]|uniref:HIT family protein n=1 Tax=Hexamita inflata TaxID=28002 RepID=A0AA86UHF2_9EUKA|nr:HIT family protein [Hexamita inflata]